MLQNLDMRYRIGEENGNRERDERRSGCGTVGSGPNNLPPTPLLFCLQLVIRYSEKKKLCEKNAFDNKKKKPGLKFNPGLALIGFRTAGLYLSLS